MSTIVMGFRRYETPHASITASAANTGILGPIFSAMLLAASIALHQSEHSSSAFLYTLSRAIAVMCLVLSGVHAHFRHSTHSILFDREYFYDPDEEGRWNDSDVNDPSHLDIFPCVRTHAFSRLGFYVSVIVLICLVCLFAISETLVHGMQDTSLQFQYILGLFILPLATKFWVSFHPLREAYLGNMDLVLAWTVGQSRQMAMIVAPFWIILAWALSKPMSLCFQDLLLTLSYFFAFSFVILCLQKGKTTYLNGFVLLGLYFLIAPALVFLAQVL